METWFHSSSRSRVPSIRNRSGRVAAWRDKPCGQTGRLSVCMSLYAGPLDRPRRPGVPFGLLPLPLMTDGGRPMGSARDSVPDPRRADSPVCPPLSARARPRPVSAIAPLAASTPRRTPPESCHPLTTGRGCCADSVSNTLRIAHASVTACESRGNSSSQPWVLMRTLFQRLQRIFRPAGAAKGPGQENRRPAPGGLKIFWTKSRGRGGGMGIDRWGGRRDRPCRAVAAGPGPRVGRRVG